MEAQIIHSQKQHLEDHIPILSTVVNRFKTQIIFLESKKQEFENLFKTFDFTSKKMTYSDLDDREYNQLQQKIIEMFPNRKLFKFGKCSYFAKDIEDDEILKKQIVLFHKNEVGHSGIIPTYERKKRKLYHPNLRVMIHQLINNCEICSSAKYDRYPIRKKFILTETPSTINEIVHVDVYVNSKHSFIAFIDKFSKYAITSYLEDRNSLTIVEKLI